MLAGKVSSTVILAVSFLPLCDSTVIVAVPFATPVITPFSSTVTIFSLLLFHFNIAKLLTGFIAGFKVIFSPIAIVLSSKDIFSIKISLLVTVTFVDTVLPSLSLAIIVVVPPCIPVTIPVSSTVAISSLLEDHVKTSSSKTFFISN